MKKIIIKKFIGRAMVITGMSFSLNSFAVDCNNTEQTGVVKQDCEALVKFFHSTGGNTHWFQKGKWLSNLPVNQWGSGPLQAIVVVEHNRVIKIYASGINLTGTLPKEIGNLSALRVLSLHTNHLRGLIPKEFNKLKKILYIHLGSNEFSGSLSPDHFPADKMESYNVYSNCLNPLNNSTQQRISEIEFTEDGFTFGVQNVHPNCPKGNIGIGDPVKGDRIDSSGNDGNLR